MGYQEQAIEGRNAVIEAYRSGRPIDKLYIQDGCQDGPVMTIKREAKKHDTPVKYVTKERLDQMSETGHHQGVIAVAGAYEYAELEDILKKAEANHNFLFSEMDELMGKKVKPADTLGILETIVEGKAKFEKWGNFEDIEIMYDWSGKTGDFTPDLNDASYMEALKSAMQNRVDAVEGFATKKEGYDKLPDEALDALKKLVSEC